MRKIIVALLFINGFAFQAVYGQVKLDVKTEFQNKLQLSVVKNGLILMLDNNSNYKVVHTREDYSLWIKQYGYSANTGTYAKIDALIELHTPAFFTHGNLVKAFHVEYRYNPQKVYIANYSIGGLAKEMMQLKAFKNLYIKAVGLSTKLEGYALSAYGVLDASSILNTFFKDFQSAMRDANSFNPSNLDKMRAAMICTAIMDKLNNYFHFAQLGN
jgi:hypothetical protein